MVTVPTEIPEMDSMLETTEKKQRCVRLSEVNRELDLKKIKSINSELNDLDPIEQTPKTHELFHKPMTQKNSCTDTITAFEQSKSLLNNTDKKQNRAIEEAEKMARAPTLKEESMLLDTSPINQFTDKFLESDLITPSSRFESNPNLPNPGLLSLSEKLMTSLADLKSTLPRTEVNSESKPLLEAMAQDILEAYNMLQTKLGAPIAKAQEQPAEDLDKTVIQECELKIIELHPRIKL